MTEDTLAFDLPREEVAYELWLRPIVDKNSYEDAYGAFAVAYAGTVEVSWDDDDDVHRVLEYLFEKFNIHRPFDYEHPSLSVGDRVVLTRKLDDTHFVAKAYRVAPFGFDEVAHPKTESPTAPVGWAYDEADLKDTT